MSERGALWGMRVTLAVRRLLGRRGCFAVLLPVVTWFWLTDASRRRLSRDWLGRAHAAAGLPPPRWWHCLGHWLNFGTKAVDSVVAAQDPHAAGPLHIEDPDGLATLAATGQGGMILVAHLGNADIARAALAGRFPRGITVLMHTSHAAHYNRMLDRLHGDPASRTLEVTELGPAEAMELAARVERGEWLAMAADRTPVDGGDAQRVVRVPFLGQQAPFPAGPWVLAALLGSPVFLLFCLARPGGGYTLRLEKFAGAVTLPRRGREEVLQALAARYAARLEAEALRAPSQWYNFYDFWG